MLSKYLIAPFVFGALIFLYLAWDVDSNYSIYLVPCAVGIALIYLLAPQIDWWWFKYRPPQLQGALRHMIKTRLPFYQNLSDDEKQRFRTRMALYIHANEFQTQSKNDMPLDLKGVIAASVVPITFGREDFLLSKFEHIIAYPHPFPSPQFPDKWHASELYEKDGVIIFSAEHLMRGFFESKQYFNIGLYEYARVFQLSYPEIKWPALGEEGWVKLERVSGMAQDALEEYIGLPDVDPVAVAVSHFFVFPEKFRVVMPEEYEQLNGILNPVN